MMVKSNKKKKTLRRVLSVMLVSGMLFTNSGMAVLAETAAEETANIDQTAAESERAAAEEEAAKAESERVAAEEAAKAESERAAAEEAAKAESERVAAEEAAKVESESGAAENTEPEQTVTEAMTEAESGTEIAAEEETTELFTESETAAEETTETESETETETESETEKEKAVLDATVKQEVMQKTLADGQIQPMVKYTVKVKNEAESADAEDVSIKALLADSLAYAKEDGESAGLVYYNAIEQAVFSEGELSEANRVRYAECENVMWMNQAIAAGSEKEFIFYAMVEDGVTDTEALRCAWLIDGVEITDYSKVQWD